MFSYRLVQHRHGRARPSLTVATAKLLKFFLRIRRRDWPILFRPEMLRNRRLPPVWRTLGATKIEVVVRYDFWTSRP